MFGPNLRTIRPVDWAISVRSLVGRGLLVGVVGPKPMVPTCSLSIEEAINAFS